MGGNLLKNLKGVRTNLESVQKSCRKCPQFAGTFSVIKSLRPYTEVQKSDRLGQAFVCFD